MSAPAIVGMLVLSLYHVVDTIFVGHQVGAIGIAGVTISLPLHVIFFALSLSVGIGASSEVSRLIGARKKEAAERTLGTATWLVTVGSALTLGLGLIFLRPILIASGADAEVLPYAVEYARVMLYGAPFVIAAVVANNLIRAEGNAPLAMKVMIVGAVVNIVLDWVFLYPLQMGIAGAAWATTIANIVSFFLVTPYFFRKKSAVQFHLRLVRWHTHTVRRIMAVGSASFAREIAFLIETLVLNHVLMALGGSVAVAAIGVLMRLAMMALMPMFGVVQGLQPIAGYNFGAGKFDRVRQVFGEAVKWSSVISVAAFVALFFFPTFWAQLFSSDPELIAITAEGLSWMSVGFAVVGVQAVSGGLYQALGFEKQSLILSLLRQVFFLIPAVLILSHFWGISGVWWSFPIAEISAASLTAAMIWKDRDRLHLRKKLQPKKA